MKTLTVDEIEKMVWDRFAHRFDKNNPYSAYWPMPIGQDMEIFLARVNGMIMGAVMIQNEIFNKN